MNSRQHKPDAQNLPDDRRPSGLFIMDLDGTLLGSDRTFAKTDLAALKKLGQLGVVRAIATGRSLASFNTLVVSGLPVDYVIFSTGAGVLQYDSGEIIRKANLEIKEVKRACDILRVHQLDFMVHQLIPDNHRFAYWRSNEGNSDFERRIELYRQVAVPLIDAAQDFGPATQLLAVIPPGNAGSALEAIRSEMTDFNVIQTTSPLDGKSTWIEIFPTTVSKSLTAAWLAETLAIDQKSIVSVGNDYNDLDLLEWSRSSYVVNNAPADLKSRFTCVASNNDGGVAEAVGCWMAEHRRQRTEDG
jgi:HAD superfamily hydrolase (TIGR01484 family)